MSDRIGNKYIVPGASANLLSVSSLMKHGCTLGAKREELCVTDVRGNMKLRARLNRKGMYKVKLSSIDEN